MASHEFRTPLTIIDGHARRLEKAREGASLKEMGERAGKIRAAVLRLTHLIENLLSSGRLIDGGAELYFETNELDLATLLREVCQLHREMVPAAEIVDQHGECTAAEYLGRLERTSAVATLDNLMTFPEVAKRVREGDLHLLAGYFDVATGEFVGLVGPNGC